MKYVNHGLRGSASPVSNGDWLCQRERAIFDPPPTGSHTERFVASDYVGDPYGCVKFGANPSTGASRQMSKITKITKILFIYLYFKKSTNKPIGQTRRRIFTLDGSNDADWRKNVPFGGFVDIAPPPFWG